MSSSYRSRLANSCYSVCEMKLSAVGSGFKRQLEWQLLCCLFSCLLCFTFASPSTGEYLYSNYHASKAIPTGSYVARAKPQKIWVGRSI